MKLIFTFFFILLLLQVKSQVNVGAWRDHLPYHTCRKVVKIGTKVYCSTDHNIFTYNTKDNSLQKLSRITGLSDMEIANMEYNSEKDILLIAYNNGNIDLIKKQSILNIQNIYKQSFPGSKKANHIFFRRNFAYISYSFGIVVFDLDRNEIKDTYVVGENGSTYEILSLVSNDNNFYAATTKGIFKADINDPFLVNYARWHRDLSIPNNSGAFNTLGVFNNRIIANYSGGTGKNDTLYYLDNNIWKKLLPGENLSHSEIRQVGNQLLITGSGRVYRLNTNLELMETINSYGWEGASPNSSYMDDAGNLWVADNNNGLVYRQANSQNYQSIYPNGPYTNHVKDLKYLNGTIYGTGGGTTTRLSPLGFLGEFFQFSDENWRSFANWNASDFTVIAPDPLNPQNVYVGAWGNGVFVYQNGTLTDNFTDKNSPLRSNFPGISSFCIGGITFDDDHNLWIAQGGVSAPISIRDASGNWASLSWGAYLGTSALGAIHIDQYKQFWVPLPPDHGLCVFDPKGTITDDKDDNIIKFNPKSMYGDVCQEIYSVTSDRDGTVWVGTNHGPVYYSDPKAVFDGKTDGNQVPIPRNDGKGTIDPLLETETINCITIDGANRKWFGTQRGGAFLCSADGTKQIYHFNTDNSPLFSNNILSIAVNDKTGEVFFGTDRGIISYRANATGPNEDFTNVYVYPNPVRENYDGVITITGLVENTIVKITDISGNLVYQTKSLGGQASWDGSGHGGRRVATGVYLVFCSNDDGSKTYVTKMLVIH
jgi:ligand-binding sensor domain-containing protein